MSASRVRSMASPDRLVSELMRLERGPCTVARDPEMGASHRPRCVRSSSRVAVPARRHRRALVAHGSCSSQDRYHWE